MKTLFSISAASLLCCCSPLGHKGKRLGIHDGICEPYSYPVPELPQVQGEPIEGADNPILDLDPRELDPQRTW